MQNNVAIPKVFPEESRFAGLRTDMNLSQFLGAGQQMANWPSYKTAVLTLKQAAVAQAMTPEELELEKRKKQLAIGVGATVLAAGAGLFVAKKMEAFRPNPAFFPGGTRSMVMHALGHVDDADTDIAPTAEGIYIIDGADKEGVALFLVTIEEEAGGVTVEIHRPEDPGDAQQVLPEKAKSLLDSVLLGDLQGAGSTILSGIAGLGQKAVSTTRVSADWLGESVAAAKMWNEVWENLVEALGEPEATEPDNFVMKALR